MNDKNNLIVYCEFDDGRVADVSLELLTKGRTLATRLGVKLEALILGDKLDGVEQQVFPYGVDVVYKVEDERLYPYTSLPHSSVVINLFKEIEPQICLMGATVIGRDLGPRVSSCLTSGLTADCTAGGRAAEELVFGSITTGAANDIEQATKLARAMITRYGMSEDFDMVAMETVTNQYLGGDTSLACSAETQGRIDEQVVALVRRQHEKALSILKDNRGKLDELASYLYEHETITGEAFMQILNAA